MEPWEEKIADSILGIEGKVPTDRLKGHINKCLNMLKLMREEGPPEELFALAKTMTWDVKGLKNLDYNCYLTTIYWKTVKNYKLFESGYSCAKCGGQNNDLHVHHKTYQFRGKELYHTKTLEVLCNKCHAEIHKINSL